jgi:hypothetical protein
MTPYERRSVYVCSGRIVHSYKGMTSLVTFLPPGRQCDREFPAVPMASAVPGDWIRMVAR